MNKMKVYPIVLSAAVVISVSTAFVFSSRERGSHDIDSKSKKEVLAVLDNFLKGFNDRNAKAHYATYHFPHYRLASGKMTVIESFATIDTTNFLDRLIQAGWDHTNWDHRNIVQASPEKVHVDTRFTRYRRDGTVLGVYESLYVVTMENGRWGIKFRSSFAE